MITVNKCQNKKEFKGGLFGCNLQTWVDTFSKAIETDTQVFKASKHKYFSNIKKIKLDNL